MTPERKQALDEYVETINKGPDGHHIPEEERLEIHSYIEKKFGMSPGEIDDKFIRFITEFPLFWVLSREFKK